MKSKLIFFAILALLITSSFCGCNNNGNYDTNIPTPANSAETTLAPETKVSDQPEEISFPQVEKIEKIQDFNGIYWISDDEILGYGIPLSPKPEKGPNITYPDRPVQVYNSLDKSKTSIGDVILTRFESLGHISPDKKNVPWMSKSCMSSMLNIETKKFIEVNASESFYNFVWINNNELVYSVAGSGTLHKYNIDGTDTEIRTIKKTFESMFMLGDRIYLIEASYPKKTAYYTDSNFSELLKLVEFYGDVSLVGNEIILNKLNSPSESVSSDAASTSKNCPIVTLDKDFKEKDTLFDENNITFVAINKNNILYLRDAENKVGLYSMDIPSKKTVELYSSSYSSSDLPFSYDNVSFGISNNRKKIFLNFVYNHTTEKPDRYETVLVSLK